MTIAACYFSSEGVVLGADSTSTVFVPGPDGTTGGLHHLNFAQKIFEIGEDSTLGVAIWGMGSIGDLSHRTLIARFADELRNVPFPSLVDAASRFSQSFWVEYTARFQTVLDRFSELHRKAIRTDGENNELRALMDNFSGGFCLGGYAGHPREAGAFEIKYNPASGGAPTPKLLECGYANFWGCPNIIQRVLFGWDEELFRHILATGKWTGTDQELFDVIWAHRIAQPADLPLREAIDWVHNVIYTTIKAMKFSHYLPVCGGPIEIAVISTDRRFRWVKHKRFDEAIQ